MGSKMSSKIRTELQMWLSEVNNVVEAAGDVRFWSNPPKCSKNVEKRIAQTEKIKKKIFWTSKNETLGIIRNAFSQSLAAVRAPFEG